MDGRIIVGLPIGKDRRIDMGTAGWVMQDCLLMGIQPVWVFSSSPEMGRNAICEQQLKDPSVGAILFLDSDVVPPAGALLDMLALDKPVVSACYPLRVRGNETWNVTDDLNKGYMTGIPRDPFRIKRCGFGCVLVRRPALEAIGWPWFYTIYKPMADDGQCIKASEDEFFCDRANTLGIEIWAHPGAICGHHNNCDLLEVSHELKANVDAVSVGGPGVCLGGPVRGQHPDDHVG